MVVNEEVIFVQGAREKVVILMGQGESSDFVMGQGESSDFVMGQGGSSDFSALKQYLRELPEPLMSFALHDEFLKCATQPQDQRLQTLWTLIHKLPTANFNNLRYLVKFLAKLAEKSDVNKMKPSNIAIVIGPNLLWSESNSAPNMLTTGTVSAIIEAIVTHADWFFPGEFDFSNVGCHDDQDSFDQSQTGAQQGSVDSLQIQPSNQHSSAGTISSNASSNNSTVISAPQESAEPVSPIHRRATRKPAPPPPPDRPFTVMVTATTASSKPVFEPSSAESDGNGNNAQFQTWPRSAPLASPESPSEQCKLNSGQDKHRISGTGTERPSMPPPDRPDRPRLPQTLNPSVGRGHQRSASTGAVMNQAANFETHTGVPNAEIDLDSLQATAL
ncbi:Rho GTPase-activating protein 44 [Bulinus truncatus]|nr:Rho GTPase-activating protein 44 [Bulinus truncatus]